MIGRVFGSFIVTFMVLIDETSASSGASLGLSKSFASVVKCQKEFSRSFEDFRICARAHFAGSGSGKDRTIKTSSAFFPVVKSIGPIRGCSVDELKYQSDLEKYSTRLCFEFVDKLGSKHLGYIFSIDGNKIDEIRTY